MFKKHQIYDQPVLEVIANLLASKNRFISNKSYEFLKNSGINNDQLKEKLSKYQP
jgi:hypothetical protein